MSKAVIVGGGIGGLTAALCLGRFGWDAVVLEQAESFEPVGAGIQLSPNAMKVFAALGLSDAVQDAGFRPEAISLRMGRSGMRLIRAPLARYAEKRWGSPYIHIHRADLLQVLTQALQERAPGALQPGMAVDGYRQDASGAGVEVHDGVSVRGDAVIGADGIHSVIRNQMLGPDAPQFTGNVAWRATVPVDRLGDAAPEPVAGAWMGRGKHAVTYLLRGGSMANLVAVVERDDWTEESWRSKGSREKAFEDFGDWHPTITRIIEEADALYQWALFDRAPFETWCDQRVTLLGDAAHPMLPFMAQGAAMAIEDGWMLAAQLSRGLPVPSALKSYEVARRGRTSRMQAGSRANAKVFHQRTLFGQLKTYGPMWLAGRLAPGIGLARQDRIYGYNVVSEAEKFTAG